MTTTIDTMTLADKMRGEDIPLYHRYPTQTTPQPAYVELDEDGEVDADWDGEIGGAVPMAVWHHRTLRWSVSPYIRGDALADWLGDPDTIQILARVHAGHSIEWDGNNNVGVLDEDAEEASQDIQASLDALVDDPHAIAQVCGVADWLAGSSIDEIIGDHDSASVLLAALESAAYADDITLDGDLARAIVDMALDHVDQGGTLTAAQMAVVRDLADMAGVDAPEMDDEETAEEA